MNDLIRQAKEYADLSEVVTATYYDEEHEEWSIRSITIKDVLDAVCDDYTVFSSTQQWTPVSEGAPKENGKYLVSVEKSEWDGTTRRSVRTMTYNKREVAPFQWGHYEIYSGKVTAWMDLPEPYEEKNDE